MKRRGVVLSPEASDDLDSLYDWIADRASPPVALAWIERLESHILGFDVASERGTRRDDIRPGLRVTGYERRVSIAFHVTETHVVILRVLYGGQDWTEAIEG